MKKEQVAKKMKPHWLDKYIKKEDKYYGKKTANALRHTPEISETDEPKIVKGKYKV